MLHNLKKQDGSPAEEADATPSAEAANPYIRHYGQQAGLTELEASAPKLDNPVTRSINGKILAFFALLLTGLAVVASYAWQLLSSPEPPPPPETAEMTITVPAPELPPLPVAASTPAPAEASAPIPLDPPREVPPLPAETPPREFRQPETTTAVPVAEAPLPPPPQEDLRKAEAPLVEDGGEETGANVRSEEAARPAARYLPDRDRLLLQGTYVRCVLESKIVSDVPGFTSCVVTEPVYSASGKRLLIPGGSKVLGQYGSAAPVGERLAVVWDRLITPDGLDLTLKSPGADHLGEAGHRGRYRSHWGSRLASALLISLMSDAFKYAGAKYGEGGLTESGNGAIRTNPYESETAGTLKRHAVRQLERADLRPDTVTVDQGSVISIYTAQDIDFGNLRFSD